MKTLRSLTKIEGKEDLPDIYCDMDQVLCNFMKGAEDAIGGSFATSDKDERWNKINQTKGFWANLDWMPGAERLYKFIEKYDPYVLSAYSDRDPSSKNGKMKWLGKNTSWKKSRINLVKRADKKLYAKTNGKQNVLIDDYIKNIKEWETAGGIGIHHTNVSKTIGELKRLGYK
jgi:5'(3')-deoxyribonucleotidase|tara:strand:- start:248 stop:766 length:519 start_codon:yes stop_codon:yes gene_type:complete